MGSGVSAIELKTRRKSHIILGTPRAAAQTDTRGCARRWPAVAIAAQGTIRSLGRHLGGPRIRHDIRIASAAAVSTRAGIFGLETVSSRRRAENDSGPPQKCVRR